jgi:hypothetical protein
MDQSEVSVLGAPETGSCDSNCSKGAASTGGVQSNGAAQGGYVNQNPSPDIGTTSARTFFNEEGTSAGRIEFHIDIFDPGFSGSFSGNATDPDNLRGHCAGDFAGFLC